MSEVISKAHLIDQIAHEQGLSKTQTKAVIDDLFERVTNMARDGHKVRIADFGTFEPKHKPAREARNPATGGTVQVKAKTSLAFKPVPSLKDL